MWEHGPGANLVAKARLLLSLPHAAPLPPHPLTPQDAKVFKRKKWKYLILDEAHMIKNWKSQRWQTLLRFNSKRRLLITGGLRVRCVSWDTRNVVYQLCQVWATHYGCVQCAICVCATACARPAYAGQARTLHRRGRGARFTSRPSHNSFHLLKRPSSLPPNTIFALR